MKLLRSFPPLQARKIIGITVTLVRDLPDALYQELVLHVGAHCAPTFELELTQESSLRPLDWRARLTTRKRAGT